MAEKENLRRIYLLLEELNEFFHQPDNYSDINSVKKFAKEIYPDIHKMYYETVWDMLSDDLKEELLKR